MIFRLFICNLLGMKATENSEQVLMCLMSKGDSVEVLDHTVHELLLVLLQLSVAQDIIVVLSEI